jgi:AcrR family transcriptional regulator
MDTGPVELPQAARSPAAGRTTLLAAAHAELDERGHAAISLRAVARRAGLSHAAPKAHFADRAALLTAVAVDGFSALADRLEELERSDAGLAALGKAYVTFGLARPALFDLMFRPSELHTDDPVFVAAQSRAIGVLARRVARPRGRRADAANEQDGPTPDLALVSWAFVQGLVVLARDGALAPATGVGASTVGERALQLVDVFADAVGPRPAGERTARPTPARPAPDHEAGSPPPC